MAYALLLATTLAVLASHWPGRLNATTVATLKSVRGDAPIIDHWSPALTWLWQQAYEAIHLGPSSVFALQTLGLATGLYLVLRSALGRIAASALASLILVAPPAFGFVGLVGRDAWFVSGCVLAVGLGIGSLRWHSLLGRSAAIAGGGAAAAIAISARQNGFAAAAAVLMGLAVALLAVLEERGKLGRAVQRRRAAVACALGLAATATILAGTTIVGNAVRDRAAHPEIYTYLYDLGYLTLDTGQELIPRLPRDALPVQTFDEVKSRWKPTTSLYMRADPRGRPASQTGVRLIVTGDEASAIEDAWRNALEDHPGAYLEGRFGLWRRQIGIGHTPLYSRAPPTDPTSYGYEPPLLPALADITVDYASHWGEGTEVNLNGGPIHHVWPYLLVCMLGLALARRRFPRPVRMAAALPAAGLGLQVGLFFLAPSVQWRYQLLVVYAAMVVVALFAALAVKALRSDRHSLRGGPVTQRPSA